MGAPGGIEANRRLTAITGLVLVVLLGFECLTVPDVLAHLPLHLFVGLLLVPPVLLKLGSTGYRFVRYQVGDARYRAAGPPRPSMRLLAPVVVLSTVALFGTGLELWLFGLRFGAVWITAHELSFAVWAAAMALHALGHLEGAQRLALADLAAGGRAPGAITRRSLLLATLVVGGALGLVTLLWPGPFLVFSG